MAEEKMLTYKGRPLARHGNDIYYGDPKDSCVVYMQVLSTEEQNGVAVANRVQVMLLSTDTKLSMRERILKASEKPSLYSALDIGSVWLERALTAK